MNKKTKQILLAILKAVGMIVIVGFLSIFIINKMEEKKESQTNTVATTTESTENIEGALDYIESESPKEDETTEEIPEYKINRPISTYQDWEYYTENGQAYIAGYLGENKKEITLPTKISSYTIGGFTEGVCYYNKELEKITIPAGYKEIPTNAFIGCENLKEVIIPSTVKVINSNAFKGCSSIESLKIGPNIELIADSALTGLTGLTELTVSPDNKKYTAENNMLFDKEKLKLIKAANIEGDFIVPSFVKEICSYAISYNDKITNITFPKALVKINSYAIYNCPNITKIVIPKITKEIEPGAFYGCDGIEAYEIEKGNKYYWVTDGMLLNYDEDTLIAFPANKELDMFIIPSTITKIESNAFINSKIKLIIIPKTIDKIDSYAFVGGEDTSIKIQIPKSVFVTKANSGWDSLYKGNIIYEK